jgi:hypothetical protein
MSLLQEMKKYGLAAVKQNENYFPMEISQNTANLWLSKKTIKITEYGNENTYYVDHFDNEFYCKNYPQLYGKI